MARIEEVSIELIDDFDGSKAAETIKFALDGKAYEIDLSKRNATELRRTLQPYVDRARRGRTSRDGSSRPRTRASSNRARRPEAYDRAEVRAWAKANRIRVSPRGRISNDVVERWRQAAGR